MHEFVKGFLLAMASLAPIGMQNAYVINIATRYSLKKAYVISFIIFLMDFTLVVVSSLFMSYIVGMGDILRVIILFFGSIIISVMGINLIRRVPTAPGIVQEDLPIGRILLTCFTITWLNPQSLIDGALILGGYFASLAPEYVKYFLVGMLCASFSWLAFLTTVTGLLKNSFNEKVLRIVNIACGVIMLCFAFMYARNFVLTLMGMLYGT